MRVGESPTLNSVVIGVGRFTENLYLGTLFRECYCVIRDPEMGGDSENLSLVTDFFSMKAETSLGARRQTSAKGVSHS